MAAGIVWHLAVIALVLAVPVVTPGWGSISAAAVGLALNHVGPAQWRCGIGLGKPADVGRTVLAGVIGGVTLFVFTKLLLQHLCEIIIQSKRDLSAFDFMRGHLMEQVPFVMATVGTAGFCEEVVYRAIVIGRLRAILPKGSASTMFVVTLSAAIFGMAHAYQGPAGMLLTALIGLVLGCVYMGVRRNLWWTVLIHATYDVLGLISIGTNFDRTLEKWSLSLFKGLW
jgi:membrane protease YdiL (CAAX protease family)